MIYYRCGDKMKTLITYQSKTGFTKKYAEWINEEIDGDLIELKKVKDVSQYDLVIHGGWIMGGLIKGLNKIKKINPKKLIVFGVGYTSKVDADMNKLVKDNKLEKIPFFYFEGGLNPKKMGFIGRTMVKLVTKKKIIYVDNTNKKKIIELVKSVKKEK